MNINNQSSNTRSMQAHNKLKQANLAQGCVKREDVDLATFTDIIDYRNSVTLNADAEGAGLAEIMESSPPKPMTSDVDAQLLFKLSFKSSVALTQLRIKQGEGSAPNLIKVYVNQENMDFQDAEDLKPALTKELEYEDGEAVVKLTGPNFSRVGSVQVLVEDNVDDEDVTTVARFAMIGHSH
jgi:hypothetical protein